MHGSGDPPTSKRRNSKRRTPARGAPPRKRRAAPDGGGRVTEAALAAFAHDVRTPLNGILALAELLAASDLPERERGWAQAIKTAAEHLAQLATLTIDAAKAGATGIALRNEVFDPRRLAQALGVSLAARAGTRGLDSAMTVSGRLPARLSGDAVRLRAAVENLIDNAVKFTESGKVSLTVGTSQAARGRTRLAFALADSGIGLSTAEIKRLFRPFAQAGAATARRYGGAGLGLAAVKRLAEAMGGSLTVASRPGGGSTFTLTVMVDAAPAASRGKARATPARAAVRALRVLCVEDNPYGRVILNTILGELGHSVAFAGSGESAVETLAAGGFDAVLMDLVLPGIDGLEATRRIRALPSPAGQVTIIGVSGRDASESAAAVQAAGMNAYLPKPVSPAALAAALATVRAA